jgi:hypothetical protein
MLKLLSIHSLAKITSKEAKFLNENENIATAESEAQRYHSNLLSEGSGQLDL